MNADIVAAAQKHPELEVIDWNVYSRSHPEWFQNDGAASARPRLGGDGRAHPPAARD